MLVKPQTSNLARIKVVGIGGAGGNAVDNMIKNYDIDGVEFIAINTDAQALSNNSAEVKLQIGAEITRGLGSGGNPQIGRKAAEESVDLIHEHLAGADLVFITCGMGGGTGTGAAPIIAGIAKNLGALTIAIVEKPFVFEGRKRMENAIIGINEIKDKVDTLIVVPNQKLFEIMDRNISFIEAMRKVDDVLAQAVKSISQLITQAGLINLDFADIKSIMANAGTALMGVGTAAGDDRAAQATQGAINSPLLEYSIKGSKGVIFNIVGGKDLAMHEIEAATNIIKEYLAEDANLIFGASIDPQKQDDLTITVIATGFDIDYSVNESPVQPRTQTGKISITSEPSGSKTQSQQTFSRPQPKTASDFSEEPSEESETKDRKKSEDDDDDWDVYDTPSIFRKPKLPKKEY